MDENAGRRLVPYFCFFALLLNYYSNSLFFAMPYYKQNYSWKTVQFETPPKTLYRGTHTTTIASHRMRIEIHSHVVGSATQKRQQTYEYSMCKHFAGAKPVQESSSQTRRWKPVSLQILIRIQVAKNMAMTSMTSFILNNKRCLSLSFSLLKKLSSASLFSMWV